MIHQQSADAGTSLHVLARTCQVLAGDTLDWWGWPDFADIAGRFAQLPDAASYAEAVTTVGFLVQFTHRLGEELHRRVHAEGHTNRCSFYPSKCFPRVQVPFDWPCGWNAGRVVQEWLVAYEAAFTGAHRDDIVQRAKRRLQSDYMELSVRGLARELGCSVAVLERRFREVADSPARYRQRVRLAAAIKLLQSSEAKVETVARAVGWNSKKELYKALAKLAGMTPTDVRRLTLADASALAAQLVR